VAARDAADTAQVTVDHAQRISQAVSDEFDPEADLQRSGALEKKGARARDGFKKRW
jgi:ribosome maturation factor RimP